MQWDIRTNIMRGWWWRTVGAHDDLMVLLAGVDEWKNGDECFWVMSAKMFAIRRGMKGTTCNTSRCKNQIIKAPKKFPFDKNKPTDLLAPHLPCWNLNQRKHSPRHIPKVGFMIPTTMPSRRAFQPIFNHKCWDCCDTTDIESIVVEAKKM